MPRMLSHRLPSRASSYRSLFPAWSFPPCSPDAFPPPSSSLSLFTDLFRLSLTAPDIFTASCRRVDLVCITATSPGPLAVRPPKLSRRHDLCFLRPSGGLIPFCCRMYTCAAAPPSLSHPDSSPFSAPRLRSRASTDLPHTTDYPCSSRSRRPSRSRLPLPSPSSETSFQRFCHPPSPSRSFALFFL